MSEILRQARFKIRPIHRLTDSPTRKRAARVQVCVTYCDRPVLTLSPRPFLLSRAATDTYHLRKEYKRVCSSQCDSQSRHIGPLPYLHDPACLPRRVEMLVPAQIPSKPIILLPSRHAPAVELHQSDRRIANRTHPKLPRTFSVDQPTTLWVRKRNRGTARNELKRMEQRQHQRQRLMWWEQLRSHSRDKWWG